MMHETAGWTKKVSDIFLRYVEPLLKEAPKDIAPDQLQSALRLPMLIWNAIVLKRWGKPNDYLQDIINHLTKSGVPEISKFGESMIHMWVQRKEDMFRDENWCIENVSVYPDFNGELIVRVIARASEEFKHQLPTAVRTDDHRSTLN